MSGRYVTPAASAAHDHRCKPPRVGTWRRTAKVEGLRWQCDCGVIWRYTRAWRVALADLPGDLMKPGGSIGWVREDRVNWSAKW